MYRVIDGRDTGKTRKLLEECAYNHGVYVCKHPERVRDKCIAYNIKFEDITGVYGYLDYLKNASDIKHRVYIDELEWFAWYCTNGFIEGYALTNED